MPVHSVIITNIEGIVLFSKYYDRKILETNEGNLFFERHLFRHTQVITISCNNMYFYDYYYLKFIIIYNDLLSLS
jgi:hypothetical protein